MSSGVISCMACFKIHSNPPFIEYVPNCKSPFRMDFPICVHICHVRNPAINLHFGMLWISQRGQDLAFLAPSVMELMKDLSTLRKRWVGREKWWIYHDLPMRDGGYL